MKQKNIFTLLQRVLMLFVLVIPLMQSYGQQKTYGTLDTYGTFGGSDVINPSGVNFAGVNEASNYAVLDVSGLLVPKESYISTKFDSSIPSNQWSYAEIGGQEAILSRLLGGNLLSGLLGTLLGDAYFEIGAYASNVATKGNRVDYSKAVFTYKAGGSMAGNRVRVMQNAQGKYLLGIRPSSNYSKIAISNTATGVLALGSPDLDVYNMFTVANSSSAKDCGKPIGTSFEGKGLTIKILDFGGKDYHYAIDDDINTASTLKVGNGVSVGIGSSLIQNFYFANSTNVDGSFNITFGGAAGVLDLGLIGGVEVLAFNGDSDVPVYKKSLKSGLLNGVDILSLLKEDKATLTFVPGKAFDRIQVVVSNVADVDVLGGGLNIYDVERFGDKHSGCENPLLIKPDESESIFINDACAQELVSFENTDLANWAIDGNNESAAILTASNGKLLGIVGAPETQGMIHMSWGEKAQDAVIPAGIPTYIRIKTDEKVLNALLGGALGGLVGGVADLLLGEYSFEVDVYQKGNTTTSVLSGKSTNSFKGDDSQGKISVVEDKLGRFYLKIQPNQDYSSIKITNKVASGLLGLDGVFNMEVYDMCRELNTVESLCGRPISTSIDGSGINIDLLGGLYPNNYHHAINGVDGEYSTLQGELLGLAVLGNVSQSFDFATPSEVGASFNLTLQFSKSIVGLDLLGGVEILAYNGTDLIYTMPLSNGLIGRVDLLGLLEKGEKFTVAFGPSKAFDRIEVKVNQGVGLNLLGEGLKIYDVERFGSACPNPLVKVDTPTENPFETPFCSSVLLEDSNVDFGNFAVDGNNESYATLVASNGPILNVGGTQGMIHMGYNKTVAANTTSYIRIDADKDLLDALLSGTLGKVIGEIGAALLGDHVITVQAYNNGTEVLKATSGDSFETSTKGGVTLVQDNIGRYYLAVSPDEQYNSVKISTKVSGLLGAGGVKTLKVFNMCFEEGTDICLPAQFTSFTQSGLNLGLGSGVGVLQGAGVTNPYYAIDKNSSNASQITAGTLGLGASVRQMIYFTQPSLVGDELKVRVQAGNSGILNLQLIGGYKVVTYLGKTKKEEFTFQQGILNGLDLIALFKSGGIQTLSYQTSQPYDRVEVVVTNVVSVNTAAELKLYDVKRVGPNCPETITQHPFEAPVCATDVIEGVGVDELGNLFDDDFDSYATLNSGAGFILGIGSGEGILELGYDQTVPAGVTSYIRFDIEKGILDKLISGSLGRVVNGILNGVLLGDHYFTVEVKDESGVVILDGNSKDDSSQTKEGIIRIMIDKVGRSYLAITPSKDYKSVRIVDKTKSVLGVFSDSNSMNVYGMCYESSTNTCQDVFATSYEFGGVDLSVTDLSGGGVQYPERAIDDNSTNFSELSVGTLGIGSNVTQWFYFNTDSAADEVVNIKFKTHGGTANIDLLGKIKIVAYKGDTQVGVVNFGGNGIVNGINVLDLIKKGEVVDLPFTPGAVYDRISISLESLVGVNVGASLEIYDVSRTCQTLTGQFVAWKSYTIDAKNDLTSVKGGEEIEYSIHVRNTGTSDIEEFDIQDELPAGLTFVSGQTGSSYDNGIVRFTNTAILKAGETQTFKFKAKVNTDLEGIDKIINIAYVSTSTSGAGLPTYPPVDNTVVPSEPDTSKTPGTIIDVQPTNEVTIDKIGVSNNAGSSNVVAVGNILTYTITVKNNSNKSIRNFQIIDIIENTADAEVSIEEADGAVIAGNSIIYTIGELKAGESKAVTLKTKVVKVPTVGQGEITNTATVEYKSPVDDSLVSLSDDFMFSTQCTDVVADDFAVDQSPVACLGTEITLTASADAKYTNVVYKWYSDQAMTTLVHTGFEFKTTPMKETTYYVTMEAFGYCFTGSAKEVVVDLLQSTASPILEASASQICSGSSVELSASPGADSYEWYYNGELTNVFNDIDKDGNDTGISTKSTVTVSEAGTYSVRARVNTMCMSGFSNEIVITELPTPVITFNGDTNILTNIGSSITLPVASATGDIKDIIYYRVHDTSKPEEATEVPVDGSGNRTVYFDQPGTFVFYVVATANNGCQSLAQIKVTVFDPEDCPPSFTREYATSAGWGSVITGGVSNKDSAVDGRPDTYATITTGVGLLGIGTTWLNLYFDEEVPAGTPVTIKLGKEYSGLVLAGGLSVVGIGSNGLDIGVIKPVKGGLLDLLSADNVVEFTFVPSNISGPKAYKGVRISQGSLVGVAQNAKVYGAYITKQGPLNCDPVTENSASNVLDVLHGVKDIGLGVASATASVSNPWNAVDNDMESYAMISRGVAVLNQAFLNVVFKQQATPGDELEIVIETPLNPVLSLELIKGFTIQRYLGDTKVGPALDHSSGILNLKLLGLLGGYKDKVKIIVAPFNQPYDRVEISYGSVVGVLGDFTKVYDVRLVPRFMEGNENPEDVYEVCDGGVLHLTPFDGCTTFEVFTEEVGGEQLLPSDGSDNRFDLSGLAVGKHTLWVQSMRNGCAVGPRVPFNININATPEFTHYLFNGKELVKDINQEYFIKVHRGDKRSTLEAMPIPSDITTVAWEMETVDPNNDKNTIWVSVPFADVVDGKLIMNIPSNGRIDGVDYSGKIVNIRAVLTSTGKENKFPCSTYGDIIQVEIAKRSNVKSNLNVTQKIK